MTGMAAKLACSQHFNSGFNAAQVRADLRSYSALFDLLDVRYERPEQRVSARLPGLSERAARYRPGLGCTLDLPVASGLDVLQASTSTNEMAKPWPLGNRVDTIQATRQQSLDALLAEDLRQGEQTRALLLVEAGRISAEAYAPGVQHDSLLLGWSMAKSFTAIMLGYLENIGKLSESEAKLFPQWRDDDRARIRVQDLLQMSAGLDFAERYLPGTDVTRMLFAAPSASAVALQAPLAHSPGSHFSYSSGTTNLLSLLYVQRLGGAQGALDSLHADILQPLGMQHTVLEMDPSRVFVGSSYMYASARDWARLGLLMLRQGELNGYRLVTADWVRRALTPNQSDNDRRYGYQFWLNHGGEELRWPDLPADTAMMNGNRGQAVAIIPSLDTVIVRLGWSSAVYPTSQKFASLLQPLIQRSESK